MDIFLSKYEGYIVDNNDPEKRGRCTLRVPGVLGSNIISEWAEPYDSYGGVNGNWGKTDVPPKGTPVWVTFIGGDVNYPIYKAGWASMPSGSVKLPERSLGNIGTYPKGNDGFTNSSGAQITEPDDPFAAQYPFNRVLKTESGILIEYDDTPGHVRIHVHHPSGSFFEIHPDGKIVLFDVSNLYVRSDQLDVHANGALNIGVTGNADITCENFSLNGGPPSARLGDAIYVFPHDHPGAGLNDANGVITEGSSNATVGG